MNILKAIGLALLTGVGGYAAGVILGMLLVYAFSANQHDKDMEATMTGFFCAGPVLALLGIVAGLGFYWYRHRPAG
jgi:hypothetical protein